MKKWEWIQKKSEYQSALLCCYRRKTHNNWTIFFLFIPFWCLNQQPNWMSNTHKTHIFLAHFNNCVDIIDLSLFTLRSYIYIYIFAWCLWLVTIRTKSFPEAFYPIWNVFCLVLVRVWKLNTKAVCTHRKNWQTNVKKYLFFFLYFLSSSILFVGIELILYDCM